MDKIVFKVGDKVKLKPKTKEQLKKEGIDNHTLNILMSEKAFEREFTIVDKGVLNWDISGKDVEQYALDEIPILATADELIPSGAYARYLKLKGLYEEKTML